MKKIVIILAVIMSLSVMFLSCRIGQAYRDCVTKCDNESDVLYITCYNTDILLCGTMIDIYERNCKEACE